MNTLESRIPAEIVGIGFTNIERQILNHLSDGEAYTLTDLKVYDRLAEDRAIQFHLHNIRKKITISRFRLNSGYENNKLVYRLVVLMSVPRIKY